MFEFSTETSEVPWTQKWFKNVCLYVSRYVDPMIRQIYWTDFVNIFAALNLKAEQIQEQF